MMMLKVADKLYIVTHGGKTRFFETREEARNYMEYIENKFLQLV